MSEKDPKVHGVEFERSLIGFFDSESLWKTAVMLEIMGISPASVRMPTDLEKIGRNEMRTRRLYFEIFAINAVNENIVSFQEAKGVTVWKTGPSISDLEATIHFRDHPVGKV